jgi:nitrogen-specific signal transduction histidine kinase
MTFTTIYDIYDNYDKLIITDSMRISPLCQLLSKLSKNRQNAMLKVSKNIEHVPGRVRSLTGISQISQEHQTRHRPCDPKEANPQT